MWPHICTRRCIGSMVIQFLGQPRSLLLVRSTDTLEGSFDVHSSGDYTASSRTLQVFLISETVMSLSSFSACNNIIYLIIIVFASTVPKTRFSGVWELFGLPNCNPPNEYADR